MDDNKNDLFHRQSSEGLGWADQWDYKNNEHGDSANMNGSGGSTGTKKEKAKEMGNKAKAAAGVGWQKTKVGASIAATKTKAGVGWIKQQVDKRRAPK